MGRRCGLLEVRLLVVTSEPCEPRSNGARPIPRRLVVGVRWTRQRPRARSGVVAANVVTPTLAEVVKR